MPVCGSGSWSRRNIGKTVHGYDARNIIPFLFQLDRFHDFRLVHVEDDVAGRNM